MVDLLIAIVDLFLTNQDQDPGVWSAGAQAAMKRAALTRYSFLPLLYTLFYKAHSTGAPVIRPLAFQ